MSLGLNDPTSPNYIADLSQRLKVAAELQSVASQFGMTAHEYLATMTGDYCDVHGCNFMFGKCDTCGKRYEA